MVSTPFFIVTILLINLSSSLRVVLARDDNFAQKGFASALGTWYGDETGARSGAACDWENDMKDYPFSSMLAAGNDVNDDTFAQKGFASALATWYGDETGAGSGAACGWENDVKDIPFSSMIAAGNANIFLKGKGCGHCFQIFCTQPPFCSGKPITVTISDECPGACNDVPFHFDLSGFAFGAMAKHGEEHNLRQLGQVDVNYQRVSCSYEGTKIAFKVERKCNPYWFTVALEYANGDGGFQSVEIAAGGTQTFVGMDNIWGAIWKRDIDPSFQPPYSFRLTSTDGKTVVANNVIPQNFENGQKYSSDVNF